MRFSLFAHMERSATCGNYPQMYREFIQLCQMADRGGFCTLWTGEHHGMDFTIAPNPFHTLIDLARQTEHVRLGTGTIVAPFWHPIRLAGEAAMADMITGHRLELGIARGAYSYEYERVGEGIDAKDAGEKLREIVPALRGLWAGDYTREGKFWSFPPTTAIPKPDSPGDIPVWIAARDPASFDFAMANQCNIQVTPLWLGDQEVETLAERFSTALVASGVTQRPQFMLLRHLYVAETEDELAAGTEQLSRFYCDFATWFQNKREISAGRLKPLSDEERAAMDQFSTENVRANLVVGTPAEVISRLQAYEALGFDEFSIWLDSGMTFAAKKKSLELFIREVMPAFAGPNQKDHV